MNIKIGEKCFWRFIGNKGWAMAWPSEVGVIGLIRMGDYEGDTAGGLVVSIQDIEIRQ